MFRCLKCNKVSSKSDWEQSTFQTWGNNISDINEEWKEDYFTCPNCWHDDSGHVEKVSLY